MPFSSTSWILNAGPIVIFKLCVYFKLQGGAYIESIAEGEVHVRHSRSGPVFHAAAKVSLGRGPELKGRQPTAQMSASRLAGQLILKKPAGYAIWKHSISRALLDRLRQDIRSYSIVLFCLTALDSRP